MSKILIIDDETGVRNLCYELLKMEGYEVTTAHNGEAALKILAQESPDLILSDLNFPGEVEGAYLKALPRRKGIPVIIFSGSLTPEKEKALLESGVAAVLSKGVDFSVLRQTVRKVLEASGKTPTLEQTTNRETILIVDDEEAIRNLLASFLRRKGYHALMAASGIEAIEILSKQRPALVLMDVTMPGMDGILTLRKIRELQPELAVVMATGAQDEFLAREAMQLGAYAYILKPFDFNYLELVISTRLAA